MHFRNLYKEVKQRAAMAESLPRIVPELVLAHKLPETKSTYTERDVAIYALGIGACGMNGIDEKELKYVYDPNGQPYIQVLPTFAVLFQHTVVSNISDIPGLHFHPGYLLHGQQYVEIYKPLPSNCHIVSKAFVSGLHDKGKAAIIEVETITTNNETGELLSKNRASIYLRGAGGFSRNSSLYSYSSSSTSANTISIIIPSESPFATHVECTQQSQALLYRLSGDYNPLHSDPEFANFAGFQRPILHGLCTLGFAVRAVIKCCCGGRTDQVKSIFGRFLLHVYPGETLVTKMWPKEHRITYQTVVKERQAIVLVGVVELNHILAAL